MELSVIIKKVQG